MFLVKRMTESLNNSTLNESTNVYAVQRLYDAAISKGLKEEAIKLLAERGVDVDENDKIIQVPNIPCTGAYGDLHKLLYSNNESLNEDASEYTALYNEIVNWVHYYVTNFTAYEVAQDIDGYDSDWAEYDGSTEISYKMDEAALKYAQVCAEGLLAYYKK